MQTLPLCHQIEHINLVDKMPAKFAEKSQFLQSQENKAAKSIEIRGIEVSEEVTLLHLKSGDNDKAAVLSEYIKIKHKRSLDMGKIYFIYNKKFTWIYSTHHVI